PTVAGRLEQTTLDDTTPNYVVIGAFSKQTNAIRFTRHAQKDLKLDAKFEMNRRRNLYYVYVLSTQDLVAAISEARRLRSESEFTDTWVYRGSLNDLTGGQEHVAMDIVPSPEVSNEPLRPAGTTESTSSPAGGTSQPTTAAAPIVGATDSATTEEPPVEDAASATADDNTEGTKFIFKIARQSDMKRLKGDVDIIDLDRSRKMGTYKGNMPVKVASPASKTGNMSVICEVFGYRKEQREINYNDPESGTDIIRDATGSVVVPFELSRLKKGDIAVMYNVYFFKDASIMRPESRYEVNSLLDMLNENTKYKIKIHGHTNGNAAGKIISMDKGSESFFALNNTRDGFGSAKELSEERAVLIRNYLVKNGIDPGRMEIKAWGGKKPIHDKMSPRAQENVRVEVEILED
ncbi:MAG TPA: OmpA family protein, partial [Chryseolinea sp.]|nr:OmpA family protein [Chryseolinea sp.]